MSDPASEAIENLTDRKHTDVCLVVIPPGATVRAVGREIRELP